MMFKLFILLLFLLLLLFFLKKDGEEGLSANQRWERLVDRAENVELEPTMVGSKAASKACNMFNCFDVYRCGVVGRGGLKVFIHPPKVWTKPSGDEVAPLTTEYYEMLEAVYSSPYYTEDPSQACFFLPSIDLLNIKEQDRSWVSRALSSLPHWNGGRNHLIFSLLPPSTPLPTGQALIATAAVSQVRPGFDLAVASFSSLKPSPPTPSRPHLLSVSQNKISLKGANPGEVVTASSSLSLATFCLADLTTPMPPSLLLDCLSQGSIPILLAPSLQSSLPLSPLVDWSSFSITFRPSTAELSLLPHLRALSPSTVASLQQEGWRVFTSHFSTPSSLILSTLHLLERRLWPPAAVPLPSSNLLALPSTPPQSQGFTALILTYNRLESLFQVIQTLGEVESLARIVVVWNHQTVPPPPAEDWPKVPKPLKVIQTGANLMSNRFQPYEEIQTEAVLSLDDDITMLTKDELEFGYQVWRQFPDRIVGFPSRTHFWENSTASYRYESEWTNELSLVLTGVAFYHSYWHYLYTAAPSKEQRQIRDWVDQHMNCEDIAFNLMVANATGKPPIKVGPRKKFKCSTPSCENVGMLSSAAGHLEERSRCLDLFLKLYGDPCPLRQVQFRADPVLYKDNLPASMKKFNDMGSL